MWHSNKEYKQQKRDTKKNQTSDTKQTDQTQIPDDNPNHVGYTQPDDDKIIQNGVFAPKPQVIGTNIPNGDTESKPMVVPHNKSVTSPPGAPPSRPPPPRQESIEKYLRNSGKSAERQHTAG